MKTKVFVVRNFERNLKAIEVYLREHGGTGVLGSLVEDLEGRVIPLLEATPRLGAALRESDAFTVEARFVLERIQKRLNGGELRRLVRGEFVLLYLVAPRGVFLLAIRHHRQLEFALGQK